MKKHNLEMSNIDENSNIQIDWPESLLTSPSKYKFRIKN